MTQDTVDRVENNAYQLNGVTYLPHYRNDGYFVGPGYPTHNRSVYTVSELLTAGASRISLMLWSRGKTGVVSQTKL
jgi:hypothetical protein